MILLRLQPLLASSVPASTAEVSQGASTGRNRDKILQEQNCTVSDGARSSGAQDSRMVQTMKQTAPARDLQLERFKKNQVPFILGCAA